MKINPYENNQLYSMAYCKSREQHCWSKQTGVDWEYVNLMFVASEWLTEAATGTGQSGNLKKTETVNKLHENKKPCWCWLLILLQLSIIY